MGGIGKTTLAAAYAFQYFDYYEKLVWITQSQDDIANDFIQNADLIQSLQIDTEGKQPDQLFGAILHALRNIEERPKLLIIDNALESLEQYIDLLPSQPAWHLLVTSREKIEGLHEMPLDFLSEDEAIALFQKHCSIITDLEQIRKLVNIVALHTLTIEILARTAQLQRPEMDQLQDALENNLKSNVKTDHSNKGKIERITSYLGTMFDFSLLSDDENWLLKQFCALPPDFHSYEFLKSLINLAASQKADVFAETLNNLVQKGWLLKEEKKDSYRIHRVMAETARHKLAISLEDIRPLSNTVSGLLYLDQTKDNPVEKFQWVPFGQACLQLLGQDENSDTSKLQNNLGLRLKDLGDYKGAKTLLEKAMLSDKKNYGEDHPTTTVSYSNLATVLQALGDYKGAKTLLEKAMHSAEKNYGEDHPTTAGRYSNLATVLQDLGDYKGAKTLLEKAMHSTEKNYGEDHPTTAVSYSNLATVLQALGDYKGAKTLLEKAMHSDEKKLWRRPSHNYSQLFQFGNRA